jgi:hypothetical protein
MGAGKSEPEAKAQAACKLLRAMRDADAVLIRDGDALRLDTPGVGKQAGKVAPALAQFCLAQDWLRLRDGVLGLSEAGLAWLRRQAGSEDGFQHQHQIRAAREVEIGGSRRTVLVNEAESPLGWLKSRKDRSGNPWITQEQFDAGERLRADYWFAQLSPRVTSNWSALAPSGAGRRAAPSDAAALRDEVIAARTRVERAIVAAGPELSGVLIDVCCELKGLEEAEKAQGWPARAGKVVLQIALNRLARHYGLISDAAPRRQMVRHWGDEDYRPSLDAWRGPAAQDQ